jgi:hypothetical protein
MNFPTSPTDGQTATVNNIVYTYNSANTSWTRSAGVFSDLTVAGNITATGFVSAAGNVTGNYIIGNGSQLTGLPAGYANSNVVSYGEVGWAGNIIPSANATYSLGNVTNQWKSLYLSNSTLYLANVPLNMGAGNVLQVDGANVVTAGTGGAISTAGNITGGNLLTGGLISSTGNVTGGNINTNGIVSASGIIYGLELSSTQSSGDEGGQVNLAIPAANTALTGQVTIDIYQNKLRFFQGNGAKGAYIDLTAAADGVGTNLLAGSGGTPGGSNTFVQFNDAGAFGGNGQFVYDKVTNTLTVGNISANSNGLGTNYAVGDDGYIGDINTADTIGIKGVQSNGANGYIVFGNADATGKLGRAGTGPLTYAGSFSATGTVTAASTVGGVITGSSASVSGTVTGASVVGGVMTGTSLSVSANVTGGNILTGGLISATGNATVGNISATNYTGTNVSVTGTVTAASTVGGVITGSSASVTGTVTAASTVGGVISGSSVSVSGAVTGASLSVSTGNITGGNLIISGAIEDSGQLDIRTTASNANIVLTPNGTGNVNTGANVSVTGRVTAASVVGGVMTGSSLSVSGAVTAASTVGGVITGSSASVSGTVTGASVVGGVMTGTSLSVSGAVTGASLVGTISTASQTNITSVGTLTSLSVSGNITGGNLITAGLVSLASITKTGSNGVGNIGAVGSYFNTVFAKATSAQYADLAEQYAADRPYYPGTVVSFGGSKEVTLSTRAGDNRIAGVVSTNPATIMNAGLESEFVATVALTGRVPTSVVGTIRKGDMMVSAGNGFAQASATPAIGTVIGKALDDFDGESGVIEIVVGRL